ncbi:MAG: flagellar motor stator protein MotA [Steroidobacteraceae bacterium]|nr:flagellar motor stator protein MotA [Steroidobacteraceae bacterium]MDW8258120.1 flagellar motor stator protein MotA [Gammaproteobacteria bacterium]
MFQFVGTVVVLACVAGGFLMAGGNLALLWHPSEIVVIIGAALGAFMTSNSPKIVKESFAGAIALFKKPRYGKEEFVMVLKLVYEILTKARKAGLLAIEADIEEPQKSEIFKKYPHILADHHLMDFLTDCLRLMVGGNLEAHELESLLEYELETHHKEVMEPSHAVQQVADALPGFGIVAAVLGIVNTMAAIEGSDTATIGAKVGAALVGTFLGILVAYGMVGPLASAMKHRAHEESKVFEIVKMALVSSVRGYPPQVAVEFARKLLVTEVRPAFRDLEKTLKQAAGK